MKTAEKNKSLLSLILNTMRPHQWVKNLFIFAPLLFGRKLADISAIGNSLLAFAVFCCLASGLYIINDIIDAEEDRSHPEKRFRPISSGALSIPIALIASLILIGTALGLAATIKLSVFLIALVYFLLTLAYCLTLKKMILLDGMTISTGFVLRIVGGALAIGVMPTHWLIVCAFLLALFLAFTKRRQELLVLSDNAGDHREVLNQYSVPFLDQVNTILISAAIVCYALYTVAGETVERFGTTGLIYGTVFVIYGMLRYMVLIRDPANGGNPSRMLIHDKPLMITVAGWAIYNALVIYHTKFGDFWNLLF
ncbi:MAG: decaprenyl-phosphate phosphoribosyltransferase [Pyrinomonadaceae bacterium]